ncbi:MAG: hypothetical protein JO340_11710 [Acidobacteriaceae bacterium]|nr:hypothetical protein [Acidobacteriaceae bacterium]
MGLSTYQPSRKQVAIEEMNRRHPVTRAYFLSQRLLRETFGLRLRTGLCAGLVQVWWRELQKGHDAICQIQHATPSLLRDILLCQIRSIYTLKPLDSQDLCDASTIDLFRFKYGEERLEAIYSLQQLFGVADALELDLVLQHYAPICRRSTFDRFDQAVIDALIEPGLPGLRLLLTRYRHRGRANGDSGHRSGFVLESAGSCRYYDPNWGEWSFSSVDLFAEWFREYCKIARWEQLLLRGAPNSDPIRIFCFGGAFSSKAEQKSAAIRNRIWTLTDWSPKCGGIQEFGRSISAI